MTRQVASPCILAKDLRRWFKCNHRLYVTTNSAMTPRSETVQPLTGAWSLYTVNKCFVLDFGDKS
jgi:hypothetical protein